MTGFKPSAAVQLAATAAPWRRSAFATLATLGALGTLALAGCSGDDDGPASAAPTSPPITLSGTVVAGPVSGQACAYRVSDAGVVGDQLACAATTAATGAYTLSFSGYTGSVLVRGFGTYRDEASGIEVTLPEASALRALVHCATAGGSCVAAVTPLTEAALRQAGTLTRANVEAASLRVAQAQGLNPANAAEALAQLVATLPATGTRSDAAAARYADILAIVSQEQRAWCGNTASCDLGAFLAHLATLTGSSQGVSTLQGMFNSAMAAWNTNPRNTSGVACSMSGMLVTCNVANAGNSGNNGGGNTASGSYRLQITVAANGIPTPTIVVTNVPKPDSESAFCNAQEVTQSINDVKNSMQGASLTVNSCSFDGTRGSISLTLTLTQPMAITLPYTVTYVYSPM